MRILAIISLLAISFNVSSQHTLKGKIVDRETALPLPFVSIVYNERGQGITSNLDGNFELSTNQPVTALRLSYLGYESQTITINQKSYTRSLLIGLAPTSYSLEEVRVKPGVNPAHRIINEVLNNREKNNPERLPEFRYNSYNKMYFTAHRDTVNGAYNQKPDSVASAQTDSLELKVEKMLRRQHLLMMESVTERIYMHPNRSHETVLASRVSGMKDPLLAFLATQYQSFSFYPELINLGGKFHLNPISKNSTSRYLFILEDTILTPTSDTLFVISFRPLRSKNFAALRGVLNINSNGYAIQNVIAEPVEAPSPVFNIKIQQRYELVDSLQWFPVELNTQLFLNMANVQVQDSVSRHTVKYQIVGMGNSYIKSINLIPNLRARDFSHVEVSFDPLTSNRDEAFWLKFRNDSLTRQELRTYHFVDSISKHTNMDRMMGMIDAIITGRIPFGIFNLDLNQLIGYNRFEGYRLGLGLETNRRASKWFTLGGYYAYGFKDKEDKFGGFTRFTLSNLHQITVEGRYENDVREPGEVTFERQFGLINTDLFRGFMVDRMDYIERFSARFGFRIFKRITIGLVGSTTNFNVASGYGFSHPDLTSPYTFSSNELGVELKFAKREAYIETAKGLMPFGFEHPVIWVNFHRGFEYNGSGFNYSKYNVRLSHQVNHKIIGKTSITLSGGQVWGDIPTPLLYFTPGSMDKYPLDATHSFGTMLPFEFVSDRYAYVFLRHNFGDMFWKTKSKLFKPKFQVVQNFAIGDYQQSLNHIFGDYQPKTLSRGFFESGLLVNGILSNPFYSIGIGTYYRWGYYSNQSWQSNLAFKLTLSTAF
jgi:hypothetical protein